MKIGSLTLSLFKLNCIVKKLCVKNQYLCFKIENNKSFVSRLLATLPIARNKGKSEVSLRIGIGEDHIIGK